MRLGSAKCELLSSFKAGFAVTSAAFLAECFPEAAEHFPADDVALTF